MIELIIGNEKEVYVPIIEDNISLSLERNGVPGKLSFNVIFDKDFEIEEGNSVRFKYNENNIFYGFVFEKKEDKDGILKIVAYDQLRYLKNKDTYVYKNKTASEVIRMISEDFGLKVGDIEDTIYKIESRIEDNKTLFDIIQTSLDLTIQHTNKMYVMYDDFGKITLKNIENMKINILVDESTGENFDYSSNINDSYNKVKLTKENKDTGKRDIYISKDTENINKWGILQYFDTVDEKENGESKANTILTLNNKKARNLSVKEVIGDTRVKAGSSIIVKLKLNDIDINNFMLVEKVTHKFSENKHSMDLTLRGGKITI